MKSKFFLGVTTLLACSALLSCSSDELPSGNEVAERNEVCYISIAISTQKTNSRAGGGTTDENEFTNGTTYNPAGDPSYEYGKVEESNVNNAYFVFYDDAGNRVGEPVNVDVSALGTESFAGSTANVGDYYTSIVPVTVLKGQTKPTQVMVYVNPNQTTDLSIPLMNVPVVTRESYKTTVDGKTYFCMSNSVYYAGSGSQSPTRATALASASVFEKREDAKAVLDKLASTETTDAEKASLMNQVSVIHVERYAAKVGFFLQENLAPNDFTPDNNNDENTFKLKFDVTTAKWGLNAIDTTTFVSKVYRSDATLGVIGNTSMPYSTVNNTLTNNGASGWKWNSPDNYRSYWGCSPAYYRAVYPEVASDYKGHSKDFNISYESFNEIMGSNGFATGTSTYSFESTVGTSGFSSNNPLASVPSVVFCGIYNVYLNDDTNSIKTGTGTDSKPITFYVHKTAGKNNLYFENNATGASAVDGGTSLMQAIANYENCLFIQRTVSGKTETVQLTSANLSNIASLLEIVHPSEAVLSTTTGSGDDAVTTIAKLPSRKVTLQIRTPAPNTENPFTVNGYTLCYGNGTSVVAVTNDNLISANKALIAAGFYADKYANGAAYYNVPILHLGAYRSNNQNMEDGRLKKDIDWASVYVGDFGLVRNHVYKINVTGISGLGTGIGNPDDPIIPENVDKTYYVNYRLNILNWAVVPVQNVDL